MKVVSNTQSRCPHAVFPITFGFCLALFLLWNIQIHRYDNHFLGSDSYIIVSKILNSHTLKWFEQTYTSQFGLQSIALAAIHNLPFSPGVAPLSLAAASVFSLLTAIAFSLPVYKIRRVAGFPAVALYWISLAFSPWLLTFSYSLYWVPFAIMLPVMTAFLFGHFMHGKYRKAVIAGVFVAMFIKCLCGYEYITTVTLFACAGYVFSHIGTPFKASKSDIGLIFAACVAGFLVALAVHVFQLHHINDTYGFSTILNRVETHTGTDGGGDDARLLITHLVTRPGNEQLIAVLSSAVNQHKLLFAWTAFKEYFYMPGLVLDGYTVAFGWFVLVCLIAACMGAVAAAMPRVIRISADLQWFALGAFLVLLGVFSWQILAWHHTSVHYHLNGQIFAYGIVPVAMIGLGAVINVLYKHLSIAIQRPLHLLAGISLCALLSAATAYTALDHDAFIDDFHYSRASRSKVIASRDLVTITPSGSELYRGMGLATTTVTVYGWAYAEGPDGAKVFVLINGGLVGEIRPDLPRDDVARLRPGAGPMSGFKFSYNVAGPVSKDQVRLLAPDGAGSYVELK